MIKINLSSSKLAGPAAASGFGSGESYAIPEEVRKDAFKKLVLLLVGPLALYIYENQNVPAKLQILDAKNQTLSQLQSYNEKQAASVAEIKQFKEDEALIETRISALEKIAKDRHKEIRVLDLLQTIIPEKAWLTKVEINPEKINIEGMALTDYEVSTFLDSLTKSAFLLDVNLVSSSEFSQDGVNLKKYEINCLLERPNE